MSILRSATVLLSLLWICGAQADPVDGQASSLCVTLLGTAAAPMGMADRAGIASLVSVGDAHYLVDAGEGVVRQLARGGLVPKDVSKVFLTHLHDDHTAGLAGLASFYYTTRGPSLTLVGPPGTAALRNGLVSFLAANAAIRMHENKLPSPPGKVIAVREVDPGVVFADDSVTVTAVENTHYLLSASVFGERQKSYAFRFDADDASIVFTGDTGESENVERLAKGANILVAEMVTDRDLGKLPPFLRAHMTKEHLSPAQVGQLAARSGVGAVVTSHVREVLPADIAEVERHFNGPVTDGQDLDRWCFPTAS